MRRKVSFTTGGRTWLSQHWQRRVYSGVSQSFHLPQAGCSEDVSAGTRAGCSRGLRGQAGHVAGPGLQGCAIAR